jgi:ribonuclease HIII
MANHSCFSATINVQLEDKLRADLITQGFEFSTPPYTLFSAKKKGVSCTLYKSGKLTVQGKEMDSFIEFYLEPEILKEFTFSHPIAHVDLQPRMGLDEAGKGDFFGPLCIAALYADGAGIQQLVQWGIKDSKTLSDATILKMAQKIRASFSYTVIRLFPLKYNELYSKFKNLNRLMAWAHMAALGELSQKTGCKQAILDQFADKAVVEKQLTQKKLDVHLEQRTKGESDVVVAGASILARAAFVEGLEKMKEEQGMEFPKGASEAVKVAARTYIEKHGKEALGTVAKLHFKTTTQL